MTDEDKGIRAKFGLDYLLGGDKPVKKTAALPLSRYLAGKKNRRYATSAFGFGAEAAAAQVFGPLGFLTEVFQRHAAESFSIASLVKLTSMPPELIRATVEYMLAVGVLEKREVPLTGEAIYQVRQGTPKASVY
ncbi:hypothetical protein R5W24_003844 [Gemmata sp. JC717]|uniref:Uncharacterized protein n=1 Tax=Gemmata algarum TaxID=2975278 RepID=A0ABU5F185_9BACT|nr:hypothetical protein [Gemmata algarum]MDY3554715.1 hypothetical protein [Gemmata algarum]MDY3561166.1 hypothetical protein [Gemmata algarum]